MSFHKSAGFFWSILQIVPKALAFFRSIRYYISATSFITFHFPCFWTVELFGGYFFAGSPAERGRRHAPGKTKEDHHPGGCPGGHRDPSRRLQYPFGRQPLQRRLFGVTAAGTGPPPNRPTSPLFGKRRGWTPARRNTRASWRRFRKTGSRFMTGPSRSSKTTGWTRTPALTRNTPTSSWKPSPPPRSRPRRRFPPKRQRRTSTPLSPSCGAATRPTTTLADGRPLTMRGRKPSPGCRRRGRSGWKPSGTSFFRP